MISSRTRVSEWLKLMTNITEYKAGGSKTVILI